MRGWWRWLTGVLVANLLPAVVVVVLLLPAPVVGAGGEPDSGDGA